MTWIQHNSELFNLERFCHIGEVGDFDLALYPIGSADTDDYFAMCFDSEDERDIAMREIKNLLKVKGSTSG